MELSWRGLGSLERELASCRGGSETTSDTALEPEQGGDGRTGTAGRVCLKHRRRKRWEAEANHQQEIRPLQAQYNKVPQGQGAFCRLVSVLTGGGTHCACLLLSSGIAQSSPGSQDSGGPREPGPHFLLREMGGGGGQGVVVVFQPLKASPGKVLLPPNHH